MDRDSLEIQARKAVLNIEEKVLDISNVLYDMNMKLWKEPEVRARIKEVISDDPQYYWLKFGFDDVYAGKFDSWGIPWLFTRLLYDGLSVVPSVNRMRSASKWAISGD